jgi:hypothetical protein
MLQYVHKHQITSFGFLSKLHQIYLSGYADIYNQASTIQSSATQGLILLMARVLSSVPVQAEESQEERAGLQ